jgi:deoxyribonuclease V
LTSEEFFHFVDTDHAASIQRKLSARIKSVDDSGFEPRHWCGMDAAYDHDTAFVAAAVWDQTSKRIVETTSAVDTVRTRYIPGFLGFREGPLLVRIAKKLRTKPDVFLIDGQGLAHPRRFGLACHVGLMMDKPTIGVAKSRLYGKPEDSNIVDPEGKVVGRILAAGHRKFYVSVGHRISLETASDLVEKCIENGHPSPLREAHLQSIRAKQGVSN